MPSCQVRDLTFWAAVYTAELGSSGTGGCPTNGCQGSTPPLANPTTRYRFYSSLRPSLFVFQGDLFMYVCELTYAIYVVAAVRVVVVTLLLNRRPSRIVWWTR